MLCEDSHPKSRSPPASNCFLAATHPSTRIGVIVPCAAHASLTLEDDKVRLAEPHLELADERQRRDAGADADDIVVLGRQVVRAGRRRRGGWRHGVGSSICCLAARSANRA